jgi:hypothetical protein
MFLFFVGFTEFTGMLMKKHPYRYRRDRLLMNSCAVSPLTLLFLLCVLCLFTTGNSRPINKKFRKPNVLLVVPGLGRHDRLQTVLHNLRILREQQYSSQKFHLSCFVYIYALRDDPFWRESADLRDLDQQCKLSETPGQRIAANLYMVHPFFIRDAFDYVFVILDDVKIPSSADFDLWNVLRIMQVNQLIASTPQILGATCCGNDIMTDFDMARLHKKCCGYRSVMQMNPMVSTPVAGYYSKYAELFAWVLTIQGYQILWKLLSPHLNPYGWGYDWWYYEYAHSRLNRTNVLGILSDYKIHHIQGSTQTDNTSAKVKMVALQRQQDHYLKYLKIPLQKYSEILSPDPVLGYLKRLDPPKRNKDGELVF